MSYFYCRVIYKNKKNSLKIKKGNAQRPKPKSKKPKDRHRGTHSSYSEKNKTDLARCRSKYDNQGGRKNVRIQTFYGHYDSKEVPQRWLFDNLQERKVPA